jgi:hypothetical protein
MIKILRAILLTVVLLWLVAFGVGVYLLHLEDLTEEGMRTYAHSELSSIWTSYQLALLSGARQPFSLKVHFEKQGSSIDEANKGSRRYEYPVSQPPIFPGKSLVLAGFHLVKRPDVRFFLLNDGSIIEWLPKVREARVIERVHEQLKCNGPVIHCP